MSTEAGFVFTATPEQIAYANGAGTRAIRKVSRLIAPVVLCPEPIGQFKKHTRESSLRLPKTIRRVNGRAVGIAIDMLDGKYSCAVHAIDVPINKPAGINIDWLIRDAVDLSAEVAAQVHEKEVIDWALSNAGAGSPIDLSDTTTDPVKVIDGEIKSLILESRALQYAVIFGIDAWADFKSHPEVKKLGSSALSWETCRNLFHTGAQFETAYSTYDEIVENDESDPNFMFPHDAILIVASSQNPTRHDPSFMKTFSIDPARLGSSISTDKDGRGVAVKFDWSTDVQVTNAAGVKRLNLQ